MNTDAQPETNPRDSVLARFMLGFPGHSLPSELAEYLAQGLAGVAIYRRNFASIEQLLDLTAAIREAAKRPVLIGIDQEGGTRFALEKPFTRWPSATELGQSGDVEATEQIACAMAAELRAAGCNLDFAPMLDLHVNPESPVTRDRSFGSDPNLVARMGAAFNRGLRQGGVLSCAKHFPGHGDATVDPHLDLPVFAGTMERLESAELVPFVAAVASDTQLIMTAHILLPQIDADNPASLSRLMLDQVLRRGMKFDGIILADDLGMGAIAKRYGPGDAAVRAIRAGTDIAMLCHNWVAVAPAIKAVGKARDEEKFDEKEWQSSLTRIERVCNLAEKREKRPKIEIIGSEKNEQLADEIRSRLK
jgi:beta-N-acetylhexosaminidase